jgi:Condensation domain
LTSENTYPLSFEQRDYLSRGHTGFGTIAACTEISGPIDFQLLTRAAQYVVGRNQPLRMRLTRTPEGLRQAFADPDLVDVGWVNLTVTARTDIYRHASEKLEAQENMPLKLKFLREDENRAYVVALLDHLACDGWSSYLFLEQLWNAYRVVVRGEKPDPRPMRYEYSDYVLDQKRSSSRRSGSAGSYWLDCAERFASSDSGLRSHGPAVADGGRADLVGEIERKSVAAARRLADSLGLSPNIIPLGCIALAAWSMGESDSVGLSFIYAGRDNPRTRSMLGLFRRYVAIVAEEIQGGTVTSFLGGLSKTTLDAVLRSRPPYLAGEFEAAVERLRGRPAVDILYNQVDQVFGEDQIGKVSQVDVRTITEALGDPHFSPGRWRGFSEGRLRLVLSGGERPLLQAIFNEGCIAESDARCLLERAVALIEGMRPEAAQRPVREFVRVALGEAVR